MLCVARLMNHQNRLPLLGTAVLFGALLAAGCGKSGGAGDGATGAQGETQFLSSFDEHPAPVLKSIKEGKRVWLLDGYRSSTITGEHPSFKEALYVVFGDGRLEYVALKTHNDPHKSKRFYRKDHEVDTWNWMPAGESQPAKTICRAWEEKEESPELARLKFTQRFESADNPDRITKHDSTAEVEIHWNQGGTQASWQSVVVSNSSVKTKGKEFPTRYEKHYRGFGKLLQSP